jgi:hypothetical protein
VLEPDEPLLVPEPGEAAPDPPLEPDAGLADEPAPLAPCDPEALPAPSPPLGFGDEEYRSAYQPPPFRMKFPPEICRLAVLLEHLGQISIGSAEIF